MKETELKPCKCGKPIPIVLQVKLPVHTIRRQSCSILCENFLCDHEVIVIGFTKRGAYKKAVKTWNRRADNEKN